MFYKDVIRWYPFFHPEDGGSTGLSDFDVLNAENTDDKDGDTSDEDDTEDDENTSDDESDDVKEKKDVKKTKSESKEEKEEDEEETDSDNEDTDTESEDDDEESNEETDKEEVEPEQFSIQALKKDYPDIFKKFPEIKTAIFREREYTKIFGSIEDAQDAADKVEVFNAVSSDLAQGNSTELLRIMNEKQVEKFALNILPAIQARNKELFFKITDKVLARVLKGATTYAEKNSDKNLALAAKYVSRFVFGEAEVPNLDEEPSKKDPDREAWEKEQRESQKARLEEQQQAIHTSTEDKLTRIIGEGLSDTTYTSFIKDAITSKIRDEVDRQLVSDKAFQSQMRSLWSKAANQGFSKEAKSRITSAYLARARRIIPSIRAKIRSENDKPLLKNSNGKKQIDSSSKGSGGKFKKVDYNKMSDEDILGSD